MERKYDRLGLMMDCSRNGVWNLATAKNWIDLMEKMGYNTLLLYTEDTYEIPERPYFGYLRGRYSQQELKELDRYAASHGVEMIPCIQTLAHLTTIFKWSAFSKMHDMADVLMPDEEATYALIEDMFASMSQSLSSRIIHIGMDEAENLGRGNYLNKHGKIDLYDVLIRHLEKVCRIAKKYGYTCIMWADMFFHVNGLRSYLYDTDTLDPVPEEIKARIPENLHLVYWDYYYPGKEHYTYQIGLHEAIKKPIWFAGGLWSWTGFVPHNKFTQSQTKDALDGCFEKGVRNIFLTSWGDNGSECSKYSLLPSVYYASRLAQGITDMETIKAGFEDMFGIPFDTFMMLDLPGTPNEEGDIRACPDKYMLYSDPFLGLLDPSVRGNDAESYRLMGEKLKPLITIPIYGYLFETMEKLCRVLSLKYDLGVKTRAAYKAGDREKLRNLIPIYDDLKEALKAFYDAFERQWMKEYKPHGFDIQDIRLGGLEKRVAHCRRRLADYVDGTTESIPELEEILLPYSSEEPPLLENSWLRAVTVNPL